MILRKLLRFVKQLDDKKMLAIFFVAALFYIASASVRPALMGIGSLVKDGQAGVISLRDRIDDVYYNMLSYEGSAPVNKGAYVNLNGIMARLMGQRQINGIVKLDNGHLSEISVDRDTSVAAAEMKELSNRQEAAGNRFLFVLAPYKLGGSDQELPAGYDDYGNHNADELLKQLRKDNIPVLDLREELQSDGLKREYAFFETDHHWRTETGFWAYTKLVDYLEKAGIIEPVAAKYTDIDQYHIDTYHDWFLGSGGRRTGWYYGGVDDFSVISPRFDTDLSMEVPSMGLFKEGDFADVVYNLEENKKDYFINLLYDTFTYGGKYRKYRNDLAPADMRILTIGDSFAWASTIYLPLIASEYDELDMRQFYGDFEAYYDDFDPDLVIVFVNAASAAEDRNTNHDFFS